MILADEDTLEWQKSHFLYTETKRRIVEEKELVLKAEEDRKHQEKEHFLKSDHIGLINQNAFFDRKNNLRDYAFIIMRLFASL